MRGLATYSNVYPASGKPSLGLIHIHVRFKSKDSQPLLLSLSLAELCVQGSLALWGNKQTRHSDSGEARAPPVPATYSLTLAALHESPKLTRGPAVSLSPLRPSPSCPQNQGCAAGVGAGGASLAGWGAALGLGGAGLSLMTWEPPVIEAREGPRVKALAPWWPQTGAPSTETAPRAPWFLSGSHSVALSGSGEHQGVWARWVSP